MNGNFSFWIGDCVQNKNAKFNRKKIIPAPTSPSIKDCDVEHYKCIYRTTAIYLILNRWNMFYSGKNATLFRSIVEMLAIVSEINNFWLDVNNFISNSHLQNDQPFTFKNHSITMNTEKENRILTEMCLLFRLKQDFPHFFHARQFHISIVIYCYARIQIAIWRMNNVKSKKNHRGKKKRM